MGFITGLREQHHGAHIMRFTGPGTQHVSLGSPFPFDPQTSPQWDETCPAGYMGVPPYCWLVDPSTGLPTYPGGPGAPVEPAPAPAPLPAPLPGGAPPAEAAPTAGWWQSLSTIEKVGLVGGAAAAGYLLVTLVRAKPKPARYTPNLAAAVKRSPTGVPLVGGKRWGHASAPKKYRKLGATKPSQYAYPARFMYPLHDRTHVSAAKSRFTKHKRRYPAPIRSQIARNINKAARRVGLEADVKP